MKLVCKVNVNLGEVCLKVHVRTSTASFEGYMLLTDIYVCNNDAGGRTTCTPAPCVV